MTPFAMSKIRYRHDATYKSLFTDPEMVASLLRRFVPADVIAEMDFSSLAPFRRIMLRKLTGSGLFQKKAQETLFPPPKTCGRDL